MYIDLHTHHHISLNKVYINDPRQEQINTQSLFCYGLHPWYIDQCEFKNILSQLKLIKDHKLFFALGEIGLDPNIEIDLTLQKEIFLKQLNFAKSNQIKAIVIHCVKIYNEVISLLKKSQYKGKIIFHGFNSNDETLQQLLQLDCVFSIGSLIHKKSKIQDTIKKIPQDRIFLETDDDTTYRIEDNYKMASTLLNIPQDELIQQVNINFKKHFSFIDPKHLNASHNPS